MAKKSMIAREVKRAKLAKRYGAARQATKSTLKLLYKEESELGASEQTGDKIMALQQKLAAMPRDSSLSRKRNRCRITGRSRGVYSKMGLGRTKFREHAMSGDIPGLTKASW